VTLVPQLELARAYAAPGQYVEVSLGTPGFFVLAGDVGAPEWELLIRNVGGASDDLARAPLGTELDVSAPLGTGFPMERARGRPLVVVVVGTAVAAARPVLRQRVASGAAHATHLYLGVRSLREVPLDNEVAGWVAASAHVVLCCSQPEPGDSRRAMAGARCAAGWAQDVLAQDLPTPRLEAASLVFAAGPQSMLDATKALARAEKRLEIITNV
jgi:NAD(P)H-flavin reductase